MIERLILVRHGETTHNSQGITQGWSDSGLSERGAGQVDGVARRLVVFSPTAVFCSTLPRAIATAEKIASRIGLTVRQLPDLREMNCGRWEGVPYMNVRRDEADFYKRWAEDPRLPCPDGESYFDVMERMQRAFSEIEAAREPVPVVVSHGTAIRIAATSLLSLPLESARSFAQDNAAINVFERRAGRYVLQCWNDTTHWSLEGRG